MFVVVSVLSLQIAKVEKLKPLEVELRRLEDLSESIVNDFAYMKKREEEMRDTNGKKTAQLVILLKRPINDHRERTIDWSIIDISLNECTCFVFLSLADTLCMKPDFYPILVGPDLF